MRKVLTTYVLLISKNFQGLDGLVASCNKFNPSIKSWDASVFDGKYVTGRVDAAYLKHLENLRADDKKSTEDLQSPEGNKCRHAFLICYIYIYICSVEPVGSFVCGGVLTCIIFCPRFVVSSLILSDSSWSAQLQLAHEVM